MLYSCEVFCSLSICCLCFSYESTSFSSKFMLFFIFKNVDYFGSKAYIYRLHLCYQQPSKFFIKRNHVFFRRLMGIHTRRFISIQAQGFTHRCYKHQPPHCLVVKMMKLKFFSSQRIRKLFSFSGVVRWETG